MWDYGNLLVQRDLTSSGTRIYASVVKAWWQVKSWPEKLITTEDDDLCETVSSNWIHQRRLSDRNVCRIISEGSKELCTLGALFFLVFCWLVLLKACIFAVVCVLKSQSRLRP